MNYHYYWHVTNDYHLIGDDDYVSGPYRVPIPAGLTRVRFSIPIVDNNVPEDNETFQLTIIPGSLPDGFTRSGDRAIVTIIDDDNG